jgi:hypothetical protein
MSKMEFVDTREDDDERRKDEGESIWDEKQFLEVLKHYANDEIIPKELRNRQWATFGKAFINTFLNKDDLPMIDILGQILRINEMQSKPPHLLTFKEVNDLDKMEVYMFFTAKRSIGIESNRINERTLQNTQIGQTISTQISNVKRGLQPGGMFRRLGRAL